MGESKTRKIIALGIMLLFLGMTISSSGFNLEKQSIKPVSFGNILYVGGNGTGNYSKIQDAINDSSDGDTVFVYDDGSPYYENVMVDKSIKLIGENRDTTIIDGNGKGSVVSLNADLIRVKGFTIQHGSIGIYLDEGHYNIISNNAIINNDKGFYFDFSYYDLITGNIIENNSIGIYTYANSEFLIFKGNHIVENNQFGIYLYNPNFIVISKNNLHRNNQSVFYEYSIGYSPAQTWRIAYLATLLGSMSVRFRNNYYQQNSAFPYPIDGFIYIYPFFNWYPDEHEFDHRRFDWNPAKEPYDIEV